MHSPSTPLFPLLCGALLLVLGGALACEDVSREEPVDILAQDTQDTASASDTDTGDTPSAPDTAADLPPADTDVRNDTSPTDTAADLPTGCQPLALSSVDATELNMLDFASVNTQRSFRVSMSHWLECNERLAMPVITLDETAHTITLQARVWSEGFMCAGPSMLVARTLTLRAPTAGTWTITAAGPAAAPLTVEVLAAEPSACGPSPGGPCSMDCECPQGEVCLSGLGMNGTFLTCAEPCETHSDCSSGQCLSMDDGLDLTCNHTVESCNANAPCPAGFSCDTGTCVADFQLSAAVRHLCTCDTECDAPLRCVVTEPGGPASCEVPCATASANLAQPEHWCGPMHYCASTGGTHDSVCEWVGE